jgi:poly(A) polymerase
MLKGCEQPPDFHPEGDVFVHTRLMLSLLPSQVSVPVVFSVLFHDIGKPPTFRRDETGRIRFNGHEGVSATMTEEIFHRLRFSNADTEATVACVKNHMSFKDVKNMRVATLKRFLARPTIEEEMELHRVDCLGSHGLLDNFDFLREKQAEFSNAPLIPDPLITGRDLITAGRNPGPLFKKILDAVQALQLEGTLQSREDALAWVAAQPEFREAETGGL